jgi:hypothetical protein
MSDPNLAIQGAIVAALKADSAVKALIGPTTARVYDRVPANVTYPYVRVGPGQTVGDDNPCFDASEVNAEVHVWSNAVGFPECKQIAAAVRRVCRQTFDLSPNFAVTEVEYVTTRYLDAPDGLTSHAVVEFRYLVDHPKN